MRTYSREQIEHNILVDFSRLSHLRALLRPTAYIRALDRSFDDPLLIGQLKIAVAGDAQTVEVWFAQFSQIVELFSTRSKPRSIFIINWVSLSYPIFSPIG